MQQMSYIIGGLDGKDREKTGKVRKTEKVQKMGRQQEPGRGRFIRSYATDLLISVLSVEKFWLRYINLILFRAPVHQVLQHMSVGFVPHQESLL